VERKRQFGQHRVGMTNSTDDIAIDDVAQGALQLDLRRPL
jgi:hypothetical protein